MWVGGNFLKKRRNIFLSVFFIFLSFVLFLPINDQIESLPAVANLAIAAAGSAVIIFILYKIRLLNAVFGLLETISTNKRLILSLSKNDFKQRFAGSYFGVIWAFVQPIVTVIMYSVVFQLLLNQGATVENNIPYSLWLICGLVPWFYFSEAWLGTCNSMLEYSFLVKKVVFRIDILPLVKVISSFIVHAFFAALMLVVAALFGYFPDLYTIQIFYYIFCLVMLITMLGILTSAITVFFRDFSQLINVLLQVGVWLVPIMWNINGNQIPDSFKWIFKFNPLYYIIMGYRDAIVYKQWFWESPMLTLYFWLFVGLLGLFAINLFNRLRPHFADVL
ncbi:MAG TPA: ABC transporter permease [Firmicutes bacterium]|nr:ABC transporter permease [Bacillota bacterium]